MIFILSFPFQHIKTWMSAVGWMVEEDSFYEYTPYGNRHFSNIIATLSPGKSRRVVLACHYDSKLMPTVRFVGAIDSAVPCSLLMDSAFRLRSFFQATKNSSSVSMAVLVHSVYAVTENPRSKTVLTSYIYIIT